MNFEDLIGNEEVKKILNNGIEKKRILHSYIFQGPDGIGKRKFAEEFARMILCTSEEKDCKECKSCIEFESGNHPDFFEITPENNSIKIEKIRNMMSKILEKPIISKHKVYIIDDADRLTKEAQNCLLKTLEEPPSFITIILITSNENNILTTIKSRCTKILFKKIDDDILEDYLNVKHGYKDLTKYMIESFQGSIKKALNILEKKEIYEELNKIFSKIDNYTILDAMNNLEVLNKNREDINELLDYIKFVLYRNIKNNYEYISFIEEIEKTKNRLRTNANYDMCIDYLLFKIWEGNN